MELWDAYDIDGNPVGVDLIRDEPIPEGMYHIVVEVLVRHEDGTYLVMQRDHRKKAYPGVYEASAGGSALKGESAIEAVRRELYEETGIVGADFRLIDVNSQKEVPHIYYNFFCETNYPKNSVVLQDGETIGYRWVTKDEMEQMLEKGELVMSQRIRFKKFYDSSEY